MIVPSFPSRRRVRDPAAGARQISGRALIVRKRIVRVCELSSIRPCLRAPSSREVARSLHPALLRVRMISAPNAPHRLAPLDRQVLGHDEHHPVAAIAAAIASQSRVPRGRSISVSPRRIAPRSSRAAPSTSRAVLTIPGLFPSSLARSVFPAGRSGQAGAAEPRKRRLADEILDRAVHFPSNSRT